MITNPKTILLITLGVLLMFACRREDEPAVAPEQQATALPMEKLDLETLEDFQVAGSNWFIAGGVQSDYQTDHSMDVKEGAGVLVNIPADEERENIFSELEHGDIELKVEFLVPKGSNSGIYFQSRYEVQILDSWRVDEPQFNDMGGIYERWDDTQPEGEQGFEGYAPSVNAALAPGLWQELHILFRAPRFDDAGNKTENARFDWVDLNGVRIHEQTELSGPTRGGPEDEVPLAPFMLQGDHGPVAFRNFRYKTFQHSDSLTLGEMEFIVYDYEGDRTPELGRGFDSLPVIAEGTTRTFDVSELSPKEEHYAIRFSGDLHVPVTGDYFFETQIINGGNLYINGEPVVENRGDVEYARPGNIIHLTEGTHKLEFTFFQITWMAHVMLAYEGPSMEWRTLASEELWADREPPPPVTVQPGEEYPEHIGGFVHYGGEKRTHILSAGHPEGIHYSYDLNRAALLTLWRSPFADVTEMWEGRGHEQLLVPLNAVIEESAGIPVARLNEHNTFANQRMPEELTARGYTLDDLGRPSFTFLFEDVMIEDRIIPSHTKDSIIRSLGFSSENSQRNLVSRIAQAEEIEQLANGLYRINGRYYLEIEETGGEEIQLEEQDGVKALFIPILRDANQSEIQYTLIW